MRSIKITALLLAALLCIPLLAACAENGGGVNTRPQGQNGSEDVGNFAQGEFDNEDFTFLYIKHSDIGKDYYGGNYLDAESLTGATIEDAVYNRNMAVEEKYKVNI